MVEWEFHTIKKPRYRWLQNIILVTSTCMRTTPGSLLLIYAIFIPKISHTAAQWCLFVFAIDISGAKSESKIN